MKLKLTISILCLLQLFTTWEKPTCMMNSIPKIDDQELESCLRVSPVAEAAAKLMMASGKAGGA